MVNFFDMKFLSYIFLSVFLPIISFGQKTVSGLYKTADCGNYQVNCFSYYFDGNGNFVYHYSQDVLGETSLTGKYFANGDTIFLKTDDYLICEPMQIKYSPLTENNYITLKIRLLPCHLKNKPDTLFAPWLVKINNEISFLETDENGVLKVENKEILKLEIRDYSQKYDLETKINSDTTIITTQTNCNIDIYLPAPNISPTIVPPLKKMIIKNKKLIGIETDEFVDYQEFKPSTNIYIKE